MFFFVELERVKLMVLVNEFLFGLIVGGVIVVMLLLDVDLVGLLSVGV